MSGASTSTPPAAASSASSPSSAPVASGVQLKADFDEASVPLNAAGFYDEIEVADMDYDEAAHSFSYPCPCGDRFTITEAELRCGDNVATCPSCSLKIRVLYDAADFDESEDELPTSDDEDGE